MVFDEVSGRKALKKRKRRFTRVTVTPEEADRAAFRRKRERLNADEKVSVILNTLLRQWLANPISGGTNNALSAAAVGVLAKKSNILLSPAHQLFLTQTDARSLPLRCFCTLLVSATVCSLSGIDCRASNLRERLFTQLVHLVLLQERL